MSESILEMASSLVKAQIQRRNIDADSAGDWLRRTHDNLIQLWLREQNPPSVEPTPSEPVNWRPSVHERYIVCMICGEQFRQLGPRHLARHGMTPEAYRQQFGMPRSQPLSARELTRRRRVIAHTVRPWELVPRRGRRASRR